MSAVGGSVKECSIRGRIFAPAGDAEVKMNLGGYQNDIHANGDGSSRQEKTMTAASLEGLVISIDHDKSDLSFLQEISDGSDFVPFSITYVDDTTFQGKCQIMGDLPAVGTKTSTAELKLGFDGKITPQ
jgi:hypothetical protein